MKHLLASVFLILVFNQCVNKETSDNVRGDIIVESGTTEGLYVVRNDKSGEELALIYDEQGIFRAISIIREDEYLEMEVDSNNNLSRLVKANLDQNTGYKYLYSNNLVSWFHEYNAFDNRTIGKHMKLSNQLIPEESLYVFVKPEGGLRYRFYFHAPFECDVIDIAVGKVDAKRIHISDRLADTTFENTIHDIVLDIEAEAFEGLMFFGVYESDDKITSRPVYFRYPQDTIIDELMGSAKLD
jgi:hypothetical protein